jgi:hypothetical protein
MEEEKNNESEQNDTTNKTNMIDNETNKSYDNNNNSEVFRPMNQQKIKINEEKLKGKKDQNMDINYDTNRINSQSTSEIRKNNALLESSFNGVANQNYYHKINRCLTSRMKKIILLIILVFGILFVFISILDVLNSMKKNNYDKKNKFLMNNIIIFIIQLIYSFCLLLFQGLTIFLEKKENLTFNLISMIFITLIAVVRTIVFIQNKNNNTTTILNLISSFTLTLINLGIFLVVLKILRMKKNVQQNIEEIINFTEIFQPNLDKNSKKDNQLQLNISDSDNKGEMKKPNQNDGIDALTEENNNNKP